MSAIIKRQLRSALTTPEGGRGRLNDSTDILPGPDGNGSGTVNSKSALRRGGGGSARGVVCASKEAEQDGLRMRGRGWDLRIFGEGLPAVHIQ